jgi:hypothetical protein
MKPTVIDTPDAIQHFRLCVIRRGLELEINTPLRHSRNSIFNAAKQITGEKTRKKCLVKLKEILGE